MPQSMLEMAKDLVMAMIQNGSLYPEDMQSELHKTHASLLALQDKEQAGEEGSVSSVVLGELGAPEMTRHPVRADWKKSIKKFTIDCLVCGASFKQLSVRHLRTHDLNPRAYRAQFGIPRLQPLSAKATTAMRKKIVQQSRPWEKAPTFMKAKQAEGGKWGGWQAEANPSHLG